MNIIMNLYSLPVYSGLIKKFSCMGNVTGKYSILLRMREQSVAGLLSPFEGRANLVYANISPGERVYSKHLVHRALRVDSTGSTIRLYPILEALLIEGILDSKKPTSFSRKGHPWTFR